MDRREFLKKLLGVALLSGLGKILSFLTLGRKAENSVSPLTEARHYKQGGRLAG